MRVLISIIKLIALIAIFWLAWQVFGGKDIPWLDDLRFEDQQARDEMVIGELKQNDLGNAVIVYVDDESDGYNKEGIEKTFNDAGVFFKNAFKTIKKAKGGVESFIENRKIRQAMKERNIDIPSGELYVAEPEIKIGQGSLPQDLGGMKYYMYKPREGTLVYLGTVPAPQTAPEPDISADVEETPDSLKENVIEPEEKKYVFFGRFMLVLLFVVLLPIVTLPLLKLIVVEHSNAYNMITLIILCGLDLTIMLLLFSPLLKGFWMFLGIVLTLILGFLYNVEMMTIALRIQEEI